MDMNDDLVMAIKWALGLMTPVVVGLVTALAILWKKLNSQSCKYSTLLREKDDELAKAREAHINDFKEITAKYYESINSVRQSIDLMISHLKD
jgi:hypothetical protein